MFQLSKVILMVKWSAAGGSSSPTTSWQCIKVYYCKMRHVTLAWVLCQFKRFATIIDFHHVWCWLDARVVGLVLDILCQLCKCFLFMIGLCSRHWVAFCLLGTLCSWISFVLLALGPQVICIWFRDVNKLLHKACTEGYLLRLLPGWFGTDSSTYIVNLTNDSFSMTVILKYTVGQYISLFD